jgi:hypothetical protein
MVPGQHEWRNKMIRNALFALAASLTTLSVLVSTLAVMFAGTGVGIA